MSNNNNSIISQTNELEKASNATTEIEALDLNEIWEQLNLTDQEKQTEKNKLEAFMEQEKNNLIAQVYERRDSLIKEIDEIKKTHLRVLQALRKPDSDQEKVFEHGNEGTLLQKLADVRAHYDEIEPLYVVRVKLFRDMYNKITYIFDKMGYAQKDRGEFSELQLDDLSSEKESIYNQKIAELEEELDERTKTVEELYSKIQTIIKELGEEISPAIEVILKAKQVTATAYETSLQYFEDISSLKEKRAKDIADLAVEITQCWELLRVPESTRKEFIDQHSILSTENIDAFKSEIEKLHATIEENLSEMLLNVKKEVFHVCRQLHYTEEQAREYISDQGNEKETFYFIAKELVELRKVLASCQPIINLIQQRNEILNEHENIDPQMMNPTQIDKIKRKFKSTLPRIEKKLLIEIIEYNEFYGVPFMWDGQQYEKYLEHIKLSQSEIKQAKNRAHKRLSKQRKLI